MSFAVLLSSTRRRRRDGERPLPHAGLPHLLLLGAARRRRTSAPVPGLVYQVFQGDSANGPIDYSAPIATVSVLSHTLPALPLGSTTRFGVRAFDTVLSLDDGNTDAAVAITIDAGGIDATSVPLAPQGVTAVATAGGGVRLAWSYPYTDRTRAPQGFRVYQGPLPGAIDYGAVVATSAAGSPGFPYSVGLGGLTDGNTYQWAVRGHNASGEGAPAIASATADATAPANPINLTVVATAARG